MNQRLSILIFIICSLYAYGQKTTFEKNVNYRAKDLKQSFNEHNDSLILKSDKLISRVDIFNENYSRSVYVNSNETTIDLGSLPLGEFIVQARLDRKRIIMYATRSESSNLKSKITKPKAVMVSKTTTEENHKTRYWVIYENNSNSGYYKSMGFKDKETISQMIDRNKLEMSTKIGKDNKLAIYEVYDTLEFMRRQMRNPEYINSASSEFFNTTPYYISVDLDSVIE